MDPRPPWTKRHHREELELLIDLGDPLLKAALDGIRDLYCLRGGNLIDDDKYISGNLALTGQRWRVLKAKLVESGYISLCDGKIQCPLAMHSYVEAASLMEQRRQAGLASGKARKAQHIEGKPPSSNAPSQERREHLRATNYNKNNDVVRTNVRAPLQGRTERRTKDSYDGRDFTIADALQQPSAPPLARTLMKRAKDE
ncbi:hypothetical protein ACRAQ6_12020 [Erythrobacter sp. HA6-11]